MIATNEAPATIANQDATRRLARIWEEILGVESVEPDQDYFDLGGDSSLAAQMFARIEKEFKIKLPLATLYEAPTIEQLAQILLERPESSGWSPLVAIQPSGWRPPFFCFHGAGGNVLNYQRLSQRLGANQPFYGLQAQGLDGKSTPLTSIEEMASLYIKHIRSVQAYGPYFLGGYCMGGTIAYEVAQQLHAAGENIGLLALFDTMNWHKIPLTVWSKSSYGFQRVAFHFASLFNLDSNGKIEFFKDKVEVLRNRVPVWRGALTALTDWRPSGKATSNSAVLRRIWQINDHASWNYVPKPYPGTITDFRPVKQYRVFNKPDLKWDGLAKGGQRVVVLPVYPASMVVEPFVKRLAAELAQFMDEATRSSGTSSAIGAC